VRQAGDAVRLSLWDRVTAAGRAGRVVCLIGDRALVWHGLGQGEVWYLLSDVHGRVAVQQELFA